MGKSVAYPRTQRIGIFIFEGFEPIDVFGFAEAFTIARFLGTDYATVPPYPFEVVLIGVEVEKVKSSNGPSVVPNWAFTQALQEPLDLLMVPGGAGTWPLLDEKLNPNGVAALLDWLTAIDKKVRIMASGKYVTSAGVSAGTDMGFYLVSRLAGRAVAEVAATAAEYDWHCDPQAPIFYPQQALVR